MVADYANLTLVTMQFAAQNLKPSELEGSNHVFPVAWSIPKAPYTLLNITWKYRQPERKTLYKSTILQSPGLGINFGYCDKVTFMDIQPWSIRILTSPLRKEVWLPLIAVITLATFACSWMDKGSFKIVTSIPLYFVTSLFSASLVISRCMSKSIMLYTWILLSYVVSIYYAATVTSVIIIPSKEHEWGSVKDMVDQNYSFVVRNEIVLNFLKAAAMSALKLNFNTTRKDDAQNDIFEIVKLTNYTSYAKTFQPYTPDKWEAEKLTVNQVAYGTKTFIVDTWPNLIKIINKAIRLLKENPRHETKTQCHLGKRLVAERSIYSVYIHPKKSKIELFARKTMDSGLFMYWWKESLQLRYSDRVQDRTRVVSPTKIIHNLDRKSVDSLKLGGYISSVFFLWLTCIIICFATIIIELIVFCVKKIRVFIFKLEVLLNVYAIEYSCTHFFVGPDRACFVFGRRIINCFVNSK